MIGKAAVFLAVLAIGTAGALFVVASPSRLPDTAFDGLGEANIENGEQVFRAGGCTSCHVSPESAESGEEGAPPVLAGGLGLASDFGRFYAPNISPGEEGVGDWSFTDFANAMLRGVTPSGDHYYPAFPYGSYSRMEIGDIRDLWAFMQTLPQSDNAAPPHDLAFPFNINRAIGLWKYLYLSDDPHVGIDVSDPVLARGRYLVEGPGHCGECHTPRNALGGFVEDRWLAGAANPSGDGRIPNITPGGDIGAWSADDIAYYLESGFTPDFDSAGGDMVDVIDNLSRLPASDREAIAAYLKVVPER